MLEIFVAKARKHGSTAITLTTDAAGNDAVNEFYCQAGFVLMRSFTQGDKRRMNEYRLDLSANSPIGTVS